MKRQAPQVERKRGPGRPKGTDSADTRETILKAAETVVMRDGAHHLTLDEVHKEAGISKGGLLHHFSGKDVLIDAMVARYLERIERREEMLRHTIGEASPNADLRASIAQLAETDPTTDDIGAALLAAVANDLDRLEPLRDVVRTRFESFRGRSVEFQQLAIVDLAIFGLNLLELLKVPPLAKSDRELVLAALDQMAGAEKQT